MLTDTTTVLIALGINPGSPRLAERYDLLRRQVESAVQSYCKWGLEQETVTEYHSGAGSPDIQLRRPFASTVTHLYLDGGGYFGQGPNAFAANTELTIGQDYTFILDDDSRGKSGLVRKIPGASGSWYWPSDLVYAQYPGGLSYRAPAGWPLGTGNLKVQYTYGFAPGAVPQDMQMAVSTGVGIAANSVKWGFPLQSENLGAHSYTLSLTKDPEFLSVRQLLGRYRDLSL